MESLFVRFAVVAAVAALAVGAGGAAAAGDPPPTIAAENQLESQILASLNAKRRARGLVPLRLSASLSTAADAHSRSMGKHGFFGHESPSGLGLRERVGHYYGQGQSWFVGENLLWSTPSLDASEAMDAWMESASHRTNILRSRWREIGLSAVSVPAAPGVFGGRSVVIVTSNFGVRW